MLVDSLIVPECIFRPGSFTALMTIYESNFIKLSQLNAKLPCLPSDNLPLAISHSEQDCDLYLKLLRRERYTTTINLTYWFQQGSVELVADPDLTLRVYHDASLVEAINGSVEHCHPQLKALARGHPSELDRRWRNNIMLNKWLDYLLEMGHRYA
jgi:uncharacterized protein YqiB (DUF1249 family)